ncbi:MAG: hypothetical protein OXU51_11065 [Candidatus Poribacteria bacterium]|nr:hypothetical protein [Candidatus Poribacteria bacterium]
MSWLGDTVPIRVRRNLTVGEPAAIRIEDGARPRGRFYKEISPIRNRNHARTEWLGFTLRE